MADLTYERLREVLYYNQETGVFTWAINRRKFKAGTLAGRPAAHGYRRITIDGTTYSEHRLVWLYMTGEWPPPGSEIDHTDRIKDRNVWSNLRLVSRNHNMRNVGVRSDNITGLKGVSFKKADGLYYARIKDGNKEQFLGCFKTAADARAAYLTAENERNVRDGTL